jgi:ABC-2 type transport system ATP-binding protein
MSPAIEARGLRRHFGETVALDDLSLTVENGEIHAIVGLNGAGKTTLMRILLSMSATDPGGGGAARILGVNVDVAGAAVWSRVGHMIEYPLAYPELTVRQNLVAAGRLHGLTRPAAVAGTDRLLSELALTPWADRRSKALSLGNKQRLGIACATIHDPQVLILDEPTNALDPAGILVVRAALQRAVARGAAVLVSSHHLDEVARIADRISVLHAGRIIGTLQPSIADLELAFFAMLHRFDDTGGTS